MARKASPVNDFFARYHRAQIVQYVLPGFFGIFIAFGLVNLSHTGDMRGLMASVSQVAAPSYDADIVMERDGTTIRVIMGRTALAADTIEFRVLSDPGDNLTLVPHTGTITPEEAGMGLYVRAFAQETVSAGTVIAEFAGIPENAPITLTDAEFTSGGERYSLTSQSK